MKHVISIVGRPNVGKSTLFNRILGYKKAITEDTPGVTRDRNYGEFDYGGHDFILIDTGGFTPSREDGFSPLIERQIWASLEESDMAIFVLDGKEGILAEDRDVVNLLRKWEKPVFYAVNKMDSKKKEESIVEFYEMGVEKLYPVSAVHGLGVDDLLEDMVKVAREMEKGTGKSIEPDEKAIRIAIVGKPNTGKSSITNRILGAERMIVSDVAGTTRDSIDSRIVHDGREIVLIDTAGLRRKSKISVKVEEYSVSSAIKSIERANIVNLVVDGKDGAGHQEGSIAHLIVSRGKGLCIVVNKWDLADSAMKQEEYRKLIREKIPHAAFAPVLFTSAKTGKNISKIVETDLGIFEQLTRRISTADINRTFGGFFSHLSIPFQQGKQVKIFYVSQAKSSPPTFILFSNHPELIPENYKRYLENSVRAKFGFVGAPIRLVFKRK